MAGTNKNAKKSSTSSVKVEAPTASMPIKAKDVDIHQYVTVRNGFQGKLVYRSSRTGELFSWDEFGSEQEMELKELKDAKNSNKKMFINNWFMFDEDWIVDYLGMSKYYKNAVSVEDFDLIFTKSPSEIKKIVSGMSDGQKKSVSYRARQLIRDKEIDSLKSISALEEVLGVELTEK